MALRDQLLASSETFSDLAWAAEQRFQDAEELLGEGRMSGAVYLFGLASEMWLKLACARFLWMGPASPVPGLLGPARTWMRAHAPAIAHEQYHSLAFWAEYLIRRRSMEGPPLSGARAGELRHHAVRRLFEDWKIDLRYRAVGLSESHGWRVYNDAIWVRRHWDQLWR